MVFLHEKIHASREPGKTAREVGDAHTLSLTNTDAEALAGMINRALRSRHRHWLPDSDQSRLDAECDCATAMLDIEQLCWFALLCQTHCLWPAS